MEFERILAGKVHGGEPIGNLLNPKGAPVVERSGLVNGPKLAHFGQKELQILVGCVIGKIESGDGGTPNGEGVGLPIRPNESVSAIKSDDFWRHRLNLETAHATKEKRAERRIMVVIGMKMLTPFRS